MQPLAVMLHGNDFRNIGDCDPAPPGRPVAGRRADLPADSRRRAEPADALHLLGLIAHQAGRHEVAVEYIERAIALKEDAVPFHNNLGEVYRALHRISKAVACYRRASKAGMIGLTHYCAASLVKEGVTVNAIAPALIETEMVSKNLNATAKLIPMGHFGSVDAVSSVAVMLAMNDYMTGQTISVNGGWYMS